MKNLYKALASLTLAGQLSAVMTITNGANPTALTNSAVMAGQNTDAAVVVGGEKVCVKDAMLRTEATTEVDIEKTSLDYQGVTLALQMQNNARIRLGYGSADMKMTLPNTDIVNSTSFDVTVPNTTIDGVTVNGGTITNTLDTFPTNVLVPVEPADLSDNSAGFMVFEYNAGAFPDGTPEGIVTLIDDGSGNITSADFEGTAPGNGFQGFNAEPINEVTGVTSTIDSLNATVETSTESTTESYTLEFPLIAVAQTEANPMWSVDGQFLVNEMDQVALSVSAGYSYYTANLKDVLVNGVEGLSLLDTATRAAQLNASEVKFANWFAGANLAITTGDIRSYLGVHYGESTFDPTTAALTLSTGGELTLPRAKSQNNVGAVIGVTLFQDGQFSIGVEQRLLDMDSTAVVAEIRL